MSYDSLIECGRELANDIAEGLIKDTELTASGRAKLSLWLESEEFAVSCLTDEQLAAGSANTAVSDGYKCDLLRAEQEYRALRRADGHDSGE